MRYITIILGCLLAWFVAHILTFPNIFFVIGSVLFCCAIVDEVIALLTGAVTRYQAESAARRRAANGG